MGEVVKPPAHGLPTRLKETKPTLNNEADELRLNKERGQKPAPADEGCVSTESLSFPAKLKGSSHTISNPDLVFTSTATGTTVDVEEQVPQMTRRARKTKAWRDRQASGVRDTAKKTTDTSRVSKSTEVETKTSKNKKKRDKMKQKAQERKAQERADAQQRADAKQRADNEFFAAIEADLWKTIRENILEKKLKRY